MDRVPSTTAAGSGIQWDTLRRLQRVQVFGASEPVGRELALGLLGVGHPSCGLFLYGRRPESFTWRDETLVVGPLHGNTPPADLAFVCTGTDLSRKLIPILQSRGTRVVDLSGMHHEDPQLPLVLADLNGHEIGAFTEIVAVPHGTTGLLARLCGGFERVSGLESVDAFVLPAADGGQLDLREPLVVERQIVADVRRLLGRPELELDVTVSPGGTGRCDLFALKLHLRSALEPRAAAGILEATPGLRVVPGQEGPRAEDCVDGAELHVGRIRAGSQGSGSLCCSAVGDQLRAGAAMAALRVASQMPAGG